MRTRLERGLLLAAMVVPTLVAVIALALSLGARPEWPHLLIALGAVVGLLGLAFVLPDGRQVPHRCPRCKSMHTINRPESAPG